MPKHFRTNQKKEEHFENIRHKSKHVKHLFYNMYKSHKLYFVILVYFVTFVYFVLYKYIYIYICIYTYTCRSLIYKVLHLLRVRTKEHLRDARLSEQQEPSALRLTPVCEHQEGVPRCEHMEGAETWKMFSDAMDKFNRIRNT